MLGAQSLLHPNCPDETACYFNSTLESRKEIEKFVLKLQQKHLRLRQVGKQVFFRSPYELFAAIFEGTRGDAKRLNRDLKNFILRFPSWKDLLPELAFLEIHQKVLLYFVSHPDLVILSGLCLTLLAVLFKTPLKIHQMYQRKSLVSFEIAGSVAPTPKVHVGVFLFGDAISFCLLDKTKGLGMPPEMDELVEGLWANNAKFKSDFSRMETEIMATLAEHLGPFSQLLLNFADFTSRAQTQQRERDEIVRILNSVRESMSGDNRDFDGDRVLRIESLGLDTLSPAVKSELIFGKKVVNEELSKAGQGAFAFPERPPGLKERYSDSAPVFSAPTLDLFERLDSLSERGGESKRTPETGETMRKHSFEGMNTILEAADEHAYLGQSAGPKPPKTPKTPRESKEVREAREREAREAREREREAKEREAREAREARRTTGALKFVNEKGEFGFFMKDEDGSDVFFHFSELRTAGIPLKTLTEDKARRVSFVEVEYTGKNNKKSKKAVDIQLLA